MLTWGGVEVCPGGVVGVSVETVVDVLERVDVLELARTSVSRGRGR